MVTRIFLISSWKIMTRMMKPMLMNLSSSAPISRICRTCEIKSQIPRKAMIPMKSERLPE